MLTVSIVSTLLFITVIILAGISHRKLESLLYYVAGYFFSSDIQSRVALESPVSEDILCTNTGDLVTFLKVRGARRFIGPQEFDAITELTSHVMRVILSDGTKRQHAISIGFLSDPPGTKDLIHEQLNGARLTARRMGADKSATLWFDAREEIMSKLCNDETILIAVYTLKTGLTPKESERYAQWLAGTKQKVTDAARQLRGAPTAGQGSNAIYSQAIRPVYPVMAQRHKAVVNSLRTSLRADGADAGLLIETLENDDALYYLRRFVDGAGVPATWRPSLFGMQAPAASAVERPEDMANALPAPIARQIFSEPMQESFDSIEAVYREGIWYGSLKLDVCPHEEPAPSFNRFVDKVGSDFPFSMHFEISPNGLDCKKTDQMFISFFGGFGSYNKSLRDAWAQLRDREAQGGYIATLRLVCSTWNRDPDKLGEQIATLKMALQGWGGSTVSNESGAPANMLLSSAPALSRFNPASYLPAPLDTLSRMLPIYRTASPWNTGQLLLRTSQGRPYPIGMGTSIQAFWGTLVFAPSGRGKSFLMNCLNAGLLFSPGLSNLPYMTIIDKGMSSANVVALARAILPPERQHQALSIRLRNTVDYAINIFDTQLGMDVPTERERDFQINVVSTLCPNLGPEGSRFIGQVIDAAYLMLSRTSMSQKRWQRALNQEISAMVEADGLELNESDMPFVWEVVDRLFDMDNPHMATMAQRFAVPTLDTLISAAHSDGVQDLFRNTPAPSGEKITEVFARAITTAAREYALLSTYTRFDVGDARVVAIDLEEVLSGATSEESRRRAAVMILFSRQLGAKNYFLKYEEIERQVPQRYAAYHSRRIKNIWETLKFLEYDEFHNAHGMTDVLKMVETDFREGRKYNVVPLLSSQNFGDFSKDLIDAATNYFILGVGSAEASHSIKEAFELSEAERKAILNDCLGPGPKGAPLFGMFKTSMGTVTQLLYNSASVAERWAFNSSSLDVAVRKTVWELVKGDYWRGLQILIDQFPDGSASDEINRVRLNMGASESADDDGVAATVGKQTVAAWLRKQQDLAAMSQAQKTN